MKSIHIGRTFNNCCIEEEYKGDRFINCIFNDVYIEAEDVAFDGCKFNNSYVTH